jgi:ubiquinol-cytochrome c reductase cytochrome c1 subunit
MNFCKLAAYWFVVFVSVSVSVFWEGGNIYASSSQKGHIEDIHWSFEGPFGVFDTKQLQRGFQVYKDVCSTCHGLQYVPFRALTNKDGPNFSKETVKAFMEDFSILDKEMGENRSAKLSDYFPVPEAVGDPPDLSLMAKARAGFHGPYGTGMNRLFRGIGGNEYIYALLTGFTEEEKVEAGTVLYGNKVFPGGYINMAPPLIEGIVEYPDGTPANVEQMAKDVVAFLMWTAEPRLIERKKAGMKVIAILVVFSVLLWLCYRNLWRPLKKNDADS